MRDANVQSKVSLAEILAIIAMSWRESFNPSLIAQLNMDVGYYTNAEGYLQWDITRLLVAPPAATEPASTAAGPARAQVVSNAFGRAAVQEVQQQQIAAVDKARRDLDAVFALNRAIENASQPVVPRPVERIVRTAAVRRNSRYGLVIGSDEHRAAQSTVAKEAGAALAKKAASASKFWANHGEGVLAAEAALLANGGELPASMTVGLLKSLIVSRTGRTAKAANNKNGEILAEARTALAAQPSTLMPAVARPLLDLSDSRVCPTCHASVEIDPTPDENGHEWCAACQGRLDPAPSEGASSDADDEFA